MADILSITIHKYPTALIHTLLLVNKEIRTNQQSVGSTGNGVPLSGLIEFAPQFESQGSRLCWENLCLPVRAGTSSLGCGTGLKVPPTGLCWENLCLPVRAGTSSLGCGTGLKVPPTVGALPRIPRD
ncbi:hypothetical protein AB3S75_021498 [Citrus x aurantiifolia]